MKQFKRRELLRQRKYSGQMLVIVALTMVALIGILGLAIDLGFTFTQKRSAQNAADAAALAGAQLLTTWSSTNNISVESTVQSIVTANAGGAVTPTLVSCNYVNDSLQAQGSCSETVPSTASGVQVTVSETHSTFFIRVIPGAPQTATTEAESTARVYQVTNAPGDAPFIACGQESAADAPTAPNNGPQLALAAIGVTKGAAPKYFFAVYHGGGSAIGATGSGAFATYQGHGTTNPLLLAGNPHNTPTPTPQPTATTTGTPTATPTSTGTTLLVPGTSTINPNAIGLTFLLHGPQIDRCGAGADFKGLADNSGANDGASIPGDWQGLNGTRAGPTRFTVSGLNGCQKNGALDSCVLLVPVADSGSGNGSNIQMHVVAVAAFIVHAGGDGIASGCTAANCHTGTLLGQYTISPGSTWPPNPTSGWLPGSNGVLMLRLVASGSGLQ